MSRPPRPDDPDADAPEWWRRAGRLSRVPVIVAIVVIVIIVRASQGTPPPSIHKSCTTAAFVLSDRTAAQHQIVRWTVTAPPGTTYQLTVGISGFVSTGGRLVATPDAGLTRAQTQAASRELTMGPGCVTSSAFGVVVPPGRYAVRLFTLSGPRSRPAATQLAERPLTVTAR